MDCETVKRRVSAYVDSALTGHERDAVSQHLNGCRECTMESERYRRVRQALRSVPRRTPPPDLVFRLRVAASKAQQQARGEATRWQQWRDRSQLLLTNLMKPLAVPAVGGLCSAVFLFSTLVPTFRSAFAMDQTPWDVPTMLTTEPTVKFMAPVAFADGEAVVDLRIDGEGRIVAYSIVSAPGTSGDKLRRSIENSLLFTEFWPATTFGRPVAGTMRISFSSSHIDVRG